MPRVKASVTKDDMESKGGGIQPKPGWYPMKVVSMNKRKEKGDYEIVVTVTKDKKFKGAQLWDYIDFANENIGWKIAQFCKAFGVKFKKKGKTYEVNFDTDDVVGSEFKGRVRADNSGYSEEYRAKLATYLALEDEKENEDSDDEDMEEDEENTEEDQDEDEEEDDEEDSEDEDEEEESDDDSDDEDEDEEEDEEEEDEKPKSKSRAKSKRGAGGSKKKSAPKGKGKGKGGKRSKKELPF